MKEIWESATVKNIFYVTFKNLIKTKIVQFSFNKSLMLTPLLNIKLVSRFLFAVKSLYISAWSLNGKMVNVLKRAGGITSLHMFVERTNLR